MFTVPFLLLAISAHNTGDLVNGTAMVIHMYGQLFWTLYIAIQDIFTRSFINYGVFAMDVFYEYRLWTDNAGKWAFIVICMTVFG